MRLSTHANPARFRNIAFKFDLSLGGVDYGADFASRAQPEAVEFHEKSVFERLEERELETLKKFSQPRGF